MFAPLTGQLRRAVLATAVGALAASGALSAAAESAVVGKYRSGNPDDYLADGGMVLFSTYVEGVDTAQIDWSRAASAGTTAPTPTPVSVRPDGIELVGASAAAKLRSLIALAEAGTAGYDAVQLGARVKPPKKPTQMTLAEILRWIDDTPGQQHAIGRYQIIPSTLRSIMRQSGISPDARFSREVQDAMADVLLLDAGYDRFTCGRLDRHAFMENLARIWAGLPTASGMSAYHGLAGNRATITWASYAEAISMAFPVHFIEENESSPTCRRANS